MIESDGERDQRESSVVSADVPGMSCRLVSVGAVALPAAAMLSEPTLVTGSPFTYNPERTCFLARENRSGW